MSRRLLIQCTGPYVLENMEFSGNICIQAGRGNFEGERPQKPFPFVEKLNWNGGLVVKVIKNAKMH